MWHGMISLGSWEHRDGHGLLRRLSYTAAPIHSTHLGLLHLFIFRFSLLTRPKSSQDSVSGSESSTRSWKIREHPISTIDRCGGIGM